MTETFTVAVCDDDKAALGIIAGSLRDVFASKGVETRIATFPSATELEKVLPQQSFDLLLLDIEMPGIDGISFGRALREHGNDVDIMFISSREDKVFDSLRVNPVGFIRKSRFLSDMSEIVGLYLDNRQRRASVAKVVLRKGSLIRPVAADEIAYVEGMRKDQVIHLLSGEGPLTMRSSMHALEDELKPAGFIRIHQGYIVNYRCIKQIEDRDVVLASGERLPISRRKAQEVREEYLALVQKDSPLVF